jgi:co-chaperonin GroES (HSP10)
VYAALRFNTTGSYNAAFGAGALANNTTANYNVAVGYQALYSNTTGTRNVAIGQAALSANTTGNYSVAIGNAALANNTTGINVAIGDSVLANNSTGNNNVAIGTFDGSTLPALYYNTTGYNNIAIGVGALKSNTTGTANVAVGIRALTSCTTSGSNTAVGHDAGNTITTGYANTIIGTDGASLTTGAYNTYVGQGARPSASGVNYELVISSSNVSRYGKGQATGFICPDGGAVYQGNNSSTWATTSDERIKHNFNPVTNGLEVINALQPTEFDYIVTGKHDVGFRAQQYMAVLPEQVSKHRASPEEAALAGEDQIYGINRNLDPYLVSAIKSLTEQVNQLKAELAALKGA